MRTSNREQLADSCAHDRRGLSIDDCGRNIWMRTAFVSRLRVEYSGQRCRTRWKSLSGRMFLLLQSRCAWPTSHCFDPTWVHRTGRFNSSWVVFRVFHTYHRSASTLL